MRHLAENEYLLQEKERARSMPISMHLECLQPLTWDPYLCFLSHILDLNGLIESTLQMGNLVQKK